MKLSVINSGHFKLDGGAMFGVVPKSLWQPLYPSDDNNMCSWAMRCMVVEDGNRLILIDTGMGNKQNDKFFSHYFMHGDDSLDKSLKSAGYHRDEITDVFLTHLHFDHCGGAIEWNDEKSAYRPAFKNAHFWSNAAHWKWATEPNAREKASFLKENILPIQESGQLKFAEEDRFSENIEIIRVNGHTESMMLPLIQIGNRKVLYMADLLPSPVHVPVAWVMAYDTRPLLTLDEKAIILKRAADEEWVLFFEHDKSVECATLMHTEKGIRVKETFPLSALFA
jgi:glyoxylase-like metal-dependent hydrolase (beta-lactamase superfamily II)